MVGGILWAFPGQEILPWVKLNTASGGPLPVNPVAEPRWSAELPEGVVITSPVHPC